MPNDKESHQWSELRRTLGYLNNAEFEFRRGDLEAGNMWLGDVRASIGALALMLSEVPDAIGQGKLLEHIVTTPLTAIPNPRMEVRNAARD